MEIQRLKENVAMDEMFNGIKPKNIRSQNLSAVFRLFQKGSPLCVQDITDVTGLSKTTVMKLITSLCEKQLVINMGKGASTDEGGKRPQLYQINTQGKYVIAIQTGRHHIYYKLFDLKCDQISEGSVTVASDIGYEMFLSVIKDCVEKLVAENALNKDAVCSIAVSIPGSIHTDEGILRYYTFHPEWGNEIPIREDLRQKLGLSCCVVVDMPLHFIGIVEKNVASGFSPNASLLYVHENAVCCVFENGVLRTGNAGRIGEVAHIVLDPHSSVRCRCGKQGCFEALVQTKRLVTMASVAAEENPRSLMNAAERLSPEVVFSAAEQGDATAQAVLDEIAGYFAAVICDLAVFTNTDQVTIIGEYYQAGDFFLDSVRRRVHEFMSMFENNSFEIRYTQQDYTRPDLCILGGAFVARQQYYDTIMD